MGGFKTVMDGFQESLRYKILADLAGAISADVARASGVELPPPTGKTADDVDVKISIVFSGEVTDKQKSKIAEVLQKYSTAAGLGG